MARTFKDVLDEKGFEWDERQELWKKSLGFGRKATVDLMFKNLFIVTVSGTKINDNFVGSLEEFTSIMDKI